MSVVNPWLTEKPTFSSSISSYLRGLERRLLVSVSIQIYGIIDFSVPVLISIVTKSYWESSLSCNFSIYQKLLNIFFSGRILIVTKPIWSPHFPSSQPLIHSTVGAFDNLNKSQTIPSSKEINLALLLNVNGWNWVERVRKGAVERLKSYLLFGRSASFNFIREWIYVYWHCYSSSSFPNYCLWDFHYCFYGRSLYDLLLCASLSWSHSTPYSDSRWEMERKKAINI